MLGHEVLGRGHNRREASGDPTAHAEVLAIREAARRVGGWRLEGTRLYVTCEPCLMCMGAIYLSRIPVVVYGSADPKAGACGSTYDVPRDGRLPHHVEVVAGVREAECRELLEGFFRNVRGQGVVQQVRGSGLESSLAWKNNNDGRRDGRVVEGD